MRKIPRKILIISGYLFRYPMRIVYYGNKYECPVCNGKFRKFLPYGIISRPNVLCPKCLSLERHRLIWIFLKSHTSFFSDNIKLLHVAPEQCFRKFFRKQKNLEYITADLESPIADVKLDIQEIPFKQNSFDMIMCNHVLEHVDNDKKALSEFYRILKPGGFAILQVPMDMNRKNTYEDPAITDPKEREKHFLQKDHLRLYGLDYPKIIQKAGFFVEEVNILKTLDKKLVNKYRLPEGEIIYYAIKK